MGRDWFRSIISLRKVKEDRSKQLKVHSATEKSNGSKSRHPTHKESGSFSNGTGTGLNRNLSVPGKPVDDIAATRIQTAFRAYMARKTLRRLKGAVRFQALIQGHSTANKQASTTLSYIHSWSRIQSQINARRLCMVTEGRIKQKKLENQLKLQAKLHEVEVEWCGGSETMEEILSRIQQREEAAVKRERAMAYAFSHQWRANSTQYLGQAYYSIGKENWGWSWMERWIAARPWETRVRAQPTEPNKVHTRQASNLDKVTNQAEMKISVSGKSALSNGKGSTKAKQSPYPAAEKQAIQRSHSS